MTNMNRELASVDIEDGPEYDVVIDTLQKRIDILRKMVNSNMNCDAFNVMDTIRLDQIDILEGAIRLYRNNPTLMNNS